MCEAKMKLTGAPGATNENLLDRHTISPEQMRHLMNSYIILRAFDLHQLKVFARK
jgi:hypothetical protein